MAKILVVDDEIQIRELLRKALSMKGYQVTTCPRANQALATMSEQAFDLVLSDINMPGDSGAVFLKKIRQTHSKVPVVIYSGFITPEIERELREAGANEILDKEVGITVLVDQIEKIVSAKERIFQPISSQCERKVLIVDDEEGIRKLLTNFLKSKGYETLEAECGEQATEIVLWENPSVVLLDVQMPGMGGLATLKKLLGLNPKLGVIMITGAQDSETAKKAIALGAYSYILKPFDFLYLELVLASKLLIAVTA